MVAMSSWFAAQNILLSPLCVCHAGQSGSGDYEKPWELSDSRGVSAICFFCPVLTMLQIPLIIKREELAGQRKTKQTRKRQISSKESGIFFFISAKALKYPLKGRFNKHYQVLHSTGGK